MESVLIKEFRDSIGRPLRADERRRFEREIAIQRGLTSPYVLPVYGIDFGADPPYYLMPMADYSLGAYVCSGAADTLDKAAAIFAELVRGVAFLHSRGLVHGDLKPANALRYRGRWALSDVGLWRAISPQCAAGEPGAMDYGYSAPERREKPNAVSEASDIYSLGTILFTILTKEVPLPVVELDRVPWPFRRIVEKSTQGQPSRRYRDAGELLAEVTLVHAGRAARPQPGASAAVDVVQRAQTELLAGELSAAATIATTLRRYSADLELYLTTLPRLVGPTLRALALTHGPDLNEIVRAYFRWVDQVPISPEYADSVAVLARRVFVCSPDLELREVCLQELLELAHRYNRVAVTDIFIELAQRCMVKGTPIMIPATRQQIDMVSDRIREGSFSPTIKRLVT
ncbi:hypothetical protein BA062_30505 [Prauserella flavalba]|uniref:non-specific serine/threonine protein kinase n=1 Tax=Prauserella flavalba TaxID=1477506 RepID=A0A318LIC8_9PSEU|nr:hypothetical protein BA062_30505 [Prauserella flavalba]